MTAGARSHATHASIKSVPASMDDLFRKCVSGINVCGARADTACHCKHAPSDQCYRHVPSFVHSRCWEWGWWLCRRNVWRMSKARTSFCSRVWIASWECSISWTSTSTSGLLWRYVCGNLQHSNRGWESWAFWTWEWIGCRWVFIATALWSRQRTHGGCLKTTAQCCWSMTTSRGPSCWQVASLEASWQLLLVDVGLLQLTDTSPSVSPSYLSSSASSW